MMVDEELAFESASGLLKLISTKQVSPVELTELFYRRIERLDPQLNSFLLLTRKEAMHTASAAESALMRGDDLGPLHGLPVPIKDTQMTAGIRTTSGSLVFEDRVPERDSAVVERVRGAGAIILGKTNVPEFGMVGTCENRLGDPGRNPWDTDCTPGGSSGGAAAAVAAFLCPVATGSDGGGSIRIPASFCGIYGIKPSHGRVSAFTGVEGRSMPNLFSQNGPLSRSVRDSALLLKILSGYDSRDPISLRETAPDFTAAVNRPIAGLRIAWSPDFGFADVDPEVLAVTSKAARVFEELGCRVEETDLVLPLPYDTYAALQTADCYTVYGKYLETHASEITDFARFFLEMGARVTASEYAQALGEIDLLKARMADLFEKYDLLLSPTACFPAFVNSEFPGQIKGKSAYPEQYWNGAFTLPINTIGHPAATVPAGFSTDGLPIGLHIVGRRRDEETVLAASGAFEQSRPWIGRRPPVS
jgi:aspartyl-tRNA(Asn)/glutamyl-tRNA(Gln) amidotransferase subunit A